MPDIEMKDLYSKPEGYYYQVRPEMIEFVPENARTMLDVGCGDGLFGLQIKKKYRTEVWGIELDADSAKNAQKNLDKVFTGDICLLIDSLPDGYFDCVIFNDVLEHLIDPYGVLIRVKNKLSKNGVVVCSIPNFRFFYSLRDFLVSKDWKYEDEGIFDKTHLRFFTYKSIKRMFHSLDFEILRIQGLSEIKSWKFKLLDLLSFGYLADTRYVQYACVARPKKSMNINH
jgi:2-polyprenyl-3-methyl-5-hydroxy-6-metoxy-1,4-benzoquinol methylase